MYTRNKVRVSVSVATTSGEKRKSSVSLTVTDQSSTQSTFVHNDPEPDFEIERHSPSISVTSSSMESLHEPMMQCQPALPAGIMPAVPPASVPPPFLDKTKPTMRACTGVDTV
jgi:hypothetical protein